MTHPKFRQELIKFDTQKIDRPAISGVEYQQGTLAGYEVREYLLEKWGRKCVYCGAKKVPLQIEHIHPGAKGGSDRVSNLALACEKCNLKKGTHDINPHSAGTIAKSGILKGWEILEHQISEYRILIAVELLQGSAMRRYHSTTQRSCV